MPDVAEHYSQAQLASRLIEAVRSHKGDYPTVDDLAAIDEFHLRGREATMELAQMAGIGPVDRVLDVGSGIGGPAIKLASDTGCSVVGIDLTPDFVDAASGLTGLVELQDLVRFEVADALDLPFDHGAFTVVWTQHVSMNIGDKGRLYSEMHRVLAPGGRLALYDVLAGNGTPYFPVPWATSPEQSQLVRPEEARALIEGAGFSVLRWDDVTQPSLEWLQSMLPKAQARPPLGLHLVMGDRFVPMLENLLRSLHEGRVRVVTAVAERA